MYDDSEVADIARAKREAERKRLLAMMTDEEIEAVNKLTAMNLTIDEFRVLFPQRTS